MSQPNQQHDHHHGHAEDENPYYLDQMCLVALSALFGAVCLSLYFWRRDILNAMLAEQFYPFVLGSGVILIILAVLRGVALWIQVGKESAASHDHDHPATDSPGPTLLPLLTIGKADLGSCGDAGHDHCGHDHGDGHKHDDDHVHTENCGHDHGHEHAHAGHDHSHAHSHHHGHSHDHGDHDHSWAPWRYVVLLVPIILFFLGIPNSAPPVTANTVVVNYDQEAMITACWIALGSNNPLGQAAVLIGTAPKRRSGEPQTVDFQFLENSAGKEQIREAWAGKLVKVTGQFVPDRSGNDRVFSLGRFRINCCRQDAVQLNVPIISTVGIRHRQNDWVQVIGEIQYRKDDKGTHHTQLMVYDTTDVTPTGADPDPYIK